MLGPGLNHFNRLGVTVASNNKHIAFAFNAAFGKRHGFCGRGGFIKHGCVGNRHARQVAHHGLKINQRFEPALRDFGLVGCVGGVPGRVFKNVALNDAGRVVAVIALANKTFKHLVFSGNCFQLLKRCRLSHRRGNCHGAVACNGARNNAVNQFAARA